MEQEPQNTGYPHVRRSTAIEGIVDTVQWVIIALMLAFLIKAFVMEPFRIPTGSMAHTLRGVHFNLRCTRCGFKYDFDGNNVSSVIAPKCPSCSYNQPDGTSMPLSNGDRIFVLKSIYQFAEPKRWDVVVFKPPLEPEINYIKRMIALPGETVEIIDGDIYINGLIERKPAKVQRDLWMPIYNNDYQPSKAMQEKEKAGQRNKVVDNKLWAIPFVNEPDSQWKFKTDDPTVFTLNSSSDSINTISYDSSLANDFRASYAYNPYKLATTPICSDLKVSFFIESLSREEPVAGAVLSKYQTSYRASLDYSGLLKLEKLADGQTTLLDEIKIDLSSVFGPEKFEFANVDHMLILEYAGNKLTVDLGRSLEDFGQISQDFEPQVKIFGSGRLDLSHVALFRDIHYISDNVLRAGQGDPFTLGTDEFFVCGDNSPFSLDSRKWRRDGVGNGGVIYNAGTVPRDYLVGKAFMVYWGDAFKPSENLMPIIPNIGQIKPIRGGSDKQL